MSKRSRVKIKEPYRTLAMYFEMLSIGDEEINIESFLYHHKKFPRVHKDSIKKSLDALLSAGVIKYEERDSVLYVTNIKENLPLVLDVLSQRNLRKYKEIKGEIDVKSGEYDLDEIYKEYDLEDNKCPILDAFFWNKAEYDSKRKKIIIH